MRDRIERVLEEEVRPMLGMHGGNVELIEVTDKGVIRVRLTGGCAGCPAAQMTVVGIVEKAIKSKVPEVKRVIAD